MKFLTFLTVVLVMLCGWSFAELEGYQVFDSTSIATNTAAQIQLKNYKVSGIPRRLLIDTTDTSTSTVTVATQSGDGSSFYAAQTLWTGTITADTSSNLATTVYLWKDKTSCTVSNSWTNTITVKVLLIVDNEP